MAERIPYVTPLVTKPKTKKFPIPGPNSTLEVTITAAPERAIQYKFNWTRLPPPGVVAACSGQVILLKTLANKRGDLLRTVRADSTGKIYGVQTMDGSGGALKPYQLHDVDDFEFSGKIFES